MMLMTMVMRMKMRMRVVMRVVMVIRMVGIDLLHLCVRHCTKLFTQIISFNPITIWEVSTINVLIGQMIKPKV